MSQQDRFINELEELEFEDRTYNMYEYYFNVAMATYLVILIYLSILE